MVLNLGPPTLAASTLPLGYWGGSSDIYKREYFLHFLKQMKHYNQVIHKIQNISFQNPSCIQSWRISWLSWNNASALYTDRNARDESSQYKDH